MPWVTSPFSYRTPAQDAQRQAEEEQRRRQEAEARRQAELAEEVSRFERMAQPMIERAQRRGNETEALRFERAAQPVLDQMSNRAEANAFERTALRRLSASDFTDSQSPQMQAARGQFTSQFRTNREMAQQMAEDELSGGGIERLANRVTGPVLDAAGRALNTPVLIPGVTSRLSVNRDRDSSFDRESPIRSGPAMYQPPTVGQVLFTPAVPAETNPLSDLPAWTGGPTAAKVIEPLTSLTGATAGAAFPEQTLFGAGAGILAGTVGKQADIAGVPNPTPFDYEDIGITSGSLYGGPGGGGQRLASEVAQGIEREGGLTQLAQRTMREELGGARVPGDAVDELTRGIRAQRQSIETNAVQQNVERAGRMAESETAYRQALNEGASRGEALRLKRSIQSGELSRAEQATVQIAEDDWAAIHKAVDDFDFGRGIDAPDFERDRVRSVLDALQTGRTAAIQENELLSLEKVLGEDLARAIRATTTKDKSGMLHSLYQLAVTPKAVLSSADVSYPLRQGVMAAPAHPVEFAESFGPSFRALGSEKAAREMQASIIGDLTELPMVGGRTAPRGALKESSGLLRSLDTQSANAEEAFRGSLAENLPGILKPISTMVRASNRAFTTFGNQFRSRIFDTITDKWARQGVEMTPERIQGLSDMLNRFTGRGTLGDHTLTDFMQAAWWSPQYRLSGPQAAAQLLNPDGAVRAEAWRNMAAFLATGGTILGAAHLSGLGKVEVDPRSSDFGKVQIGDMHVNPWGSSATLVRTLAQIASGETKSAARGIVPKDRLGTGIQYFRSGLAPEWSVVWDILAGKDYLGRPVRLEPGALPGLAKDNLLPLVAQDAIDAFEQEGLLGASFATPFSFFGGGLQSFEPGVTRQLDAIPEFVGLDTKSQYQIEKFLDQVEVARDEWRAQGSEVGNEAAIRQVAKYQGRGDGFTQWAIALSSSDRRSKLRNPEWVQFVVDNADALRDYRPYLFESNYIIDAIREGNANVRE